MPTIQSISLVLLSMLMFAAPGIGVWTWIAWMLSREKISLREILIFVGCLGAVFLYYDWWYAPIPA